MLRKTALFIILALVAMQFFHADKNINSSDDEDRNDISMAFAIPDNVQDVLQKSCYDCHSNNTNYPWYAEIQPIGWWLDHHITEGKSELNFNEFATYSPRRQYKKLEEIIEQVKEGEMPLGSYTLIHKDAVVSKEKKIAITKWANAAIDSMKTRYPPDSLIRKK